MTSINPVGSVCEHSDHKGSCTSTRKHGALDDRLSKTITAWPWSQMVANLCVVGRCSLTDWRLAKGSGGDHLVANLGHDLDKAQRGLRQRTERGCIEQIFELDARPEWQNDQALRDKYDGGRGVNDRTADAQGYEVRSEEHTSELQSLMRISSAVFCLKKNTHSDTT